MIINNTIVGPDLWEEIKDLDIIDAMNYLYHKGFFGDDAPLKNKEGVPYGSIFETGIKFNFNIIELFDFKEKIRQLELLIRLKHKYSRPYDEQISKLENIYEQLKVLNVLHE